MALGALEAVKARGLTGIRIYGFDALPEALARIKDGSLAGTVEQFPGEQSRIAPWTSRSPSPATAGNRRGRWTLLTPVVITRDNLARAERLSEMR